MKISNYIKSLVLGACVLAFVPGCGTVHKEGKENLSIATSFPAPPSGYAGIYIYRDDGVLANLTKVTVNLDFANKSLYIDGHYIGDTDSSVFFYRLVKPGEHVFQTESVTSENDLKMYVNEGHNYYIEQYAIPGVLQNHIALKLVSASHAQPIIKELPLAKNADNKSKNLKDADYSEGKGSISGVQ